MIGVPPGSPTDGAGGVTPGAGSPIGGADGVPPGSPTGGRAGGVTGVPPGSPTGGSPGVVPGGRLGSPISAMGVVTGRVPASGRVAARLESVWVRLPSVASRLDDTGRD